MVPETQRTEKREERRGEKGMGREGRFGERRAPRCLSGEGKWRGIGGPRDWREASLITP
jgi:hypothetical protein